VDFSGGSSSDSSTHFGDGCDSRLSGSAQRSAVAQCSRILAVELLQLKIEFRVFGLKRARLLEERLGCDSEELGRVGRAVTDSLREVLEFSES
jgi:hypothetical protein